VAFRLHRPRPPRRRVASAGAGVIVLVAAHGRPAGVVRSARAYRSNEEAIHPAYCSRGAGARRRGSIRRSLSLDEDGSVAAVEEEDEVEAPGLYLDLAAAAAAADDDAASAAAVANPAVGDVAALDDSEKTRTTEKLDEALTAEDMVQPPAPGEAAAAAAAEAQEHAAAVLQAGASTTPLITST